MSTERQGKRKLSLSPDLEGSSPPRQMLRAGPQGSPSLSVGQASSAPLKPLSKEAKELSDRLLKRKTEVLSDRKDATMRKLKDSYIRALYEEETEEFILRQQIIENEHLRPLSSYCKIITALMQTTWVDGDSTEALLQTLRMSAFENLRPVIIHQMWVRPISRFYKTSDTLPDDLSPEICEAIIANCCYVVNSRHLLNDLAPSSFKRALADSDVYETATLVMRERVVNTCKVNEFVVLDVEGRLDTIVRSTKGLQVVNIRTEKSVTIFVKSFTSEANWKKVIGDAMTDASGRDVIQALVDASEQGEKYIHHHSTGFDFRAMEDISKEAGIHKQTTQISRSTWAMVTSIGRLTFFTPLYILRDILPEWPTLAQAYCHRNLHAIAQVRAEREDEDDVLIDLLDENIDANEDDPRFKRLVEANFPEAIAKVLIPKVIKCNLDTRQELELNNVAYEWFGQALAKWKGDGAVEDSSDEIEELTPAQVYGMQLTEPDAINNTLNLRIQHIWMAVKKVIGSQIKDRTFSDLAAHAKEGKISWARR